MRGEMLENKKLSSKSLCRAFLTLLGLGLVWFVTSTSGLVGNFANAEMGTLKILDEQGLVRAVKEIPGQGAVSIEANLGDSKITLQCIDRLQPEREGELVGKRLVFKNIGPGTWRITGSQEGITKVTITAE
jgi:hypothetical protein